MRPATLFALAALFLAAPLVARAGPGQLPILRFGMETRSLPFCFVPGLDYSREDRHKPPLLTPAQSSHLDGLEVDIMRAIARRLGVRAVVVPTAWFDLEAGLVAGRFDVILATWTPSETTPPEIAASDPYLHWGLILATRANDKRVNGLSDLEGLRLGHFADPAVGRAIQQMGAGLDMKLFPSEDGAALFDMLRKGSVDAVLYDSPEVRWRARHDAAFRVVGSPLNRLGYHLGVRSAERTQLQRLNGVLHDLLESDEMKEIRRRWDAVD